MRAFLALDLPDDARDALERVQSRLPVGRHVLPEDMHLTLAFFDSATLAQLDELHLSLEMSAPPMFSITLKGLNTFGATPPRSLHALAHAAALAGYQRKIATLSRGAGLSLPHRRFIPHITLARFSNRISPDDMARIGRFLSAHADFTCAPFIPPSLSLYQSTLYPEGARYDVLERYPLYSLLSRTSSNG